MTESWCVESGRCFLVLLLLSPLLLLQGSQGLGELQSILCERFQGLIGSLTKLHHQVAPDLRGDHRLQVCLDLLKRFALSIDVVDRGCPVCQAFSHLRRTARACVFLDKKDLALVNSKLPVDQQADTFRTLARHLQTMQRQKVLCLSVPRETPFLTL